MYIKKFKPLTVIMSVWMIYDRMCGKCYNAIDTWKRKNSDVCTQYSELK